MKKEVTFICEYCGRHFKKLDSCTAHEIVCSKTHADTVRFETLLMSLVNNFESRGYAVYIKYIDSDLILYLTKK